MRTRLWIQRMIFLLSILMVLSFGKTIMVEAAETPKEEIKLTEEFLTGVWVCSEGFVCSYEAGTFVDSKNKLVDCKVNDGVVTGTSAYVKLDSSKITIIDKDTIIIGEDTAVRAESKLGKEYQAQLVKLLIGKWLIINGDFKISMEFKADKSLIVSSDTKENFNYELVSGGMRIIDPKSGKIEDDTSFLRIHEDTLSFYGTVDGLELYRDGSPISIEEQSGKSELLGEWIFLSKDGKPISQWKFDSSNILTIDYFSKKKDTKQAFLASRKDINFYITIGGKHYYLNEIYGTGDFNNYQVTGNIEGTLVRKDSKEGKEYVKIAKAMNSPGKLMQCTQCQKFNSDLYPEVTAISVSLQCMSNLWLKDEIQIEVNPSCDSQLLGEYGHGYSVYSKLKLKNAKITFTYDESLLPYEYEKDVVIVHIDSKTGKRNVLKTTRNLKSNRVAAKITEGGIYYLADSVIINGGTRDIPSRDPKTTGWAKNNDTGDILSLIDLNYIKKSNGNFEVSTVAELASVVYYVNTTPNACPNITLEKDIDLSGYEWAPMGWSSSPENSFGFNGTINGNNHTIRNLHIDTNGLAVGLLGWATYAHVFDLNITKANVNGGKEVGILTGESICCIYDNCHVEGVVNGEEAGSLVGYDANNEFIECSADVIVNGSKFDFLSWNQKEISEIIIKD